jgi:hypothetical protein
MSESLEPDVTPIIQRSYVGFLLDVSRVRFM